MKTILLCLLVSACTVPLGELPGRAPTAPPPGAPAPVGTHAQVADAVVAESNRARQQQGVRTFTTDPALVRAAMDYAAELARRRVLDHNSPTPGRQTMTQRIEAAGGRWVRAAENLSSRSGTPAAQVPAATVQGWLGSPGHRANLLDPAYTHTGAGVAQDAQGVWYVVQLYTLPPARD